jgi:hypothetical protein
MLPGSQEYAERALDFEEAMPLKRDSTAMRALNTEDRMNAARTAAGISRRFAKERRGEDSDMDASWRQAVVAAVTSAKRYRNRGRVRDKSSREYGNATQR